MSTTTTALTLSHRPPRSQSQWRRCVAIVMERKYVAIGVFVASVALGLTWIGWQTPIYRATACLQIDNDPIKVLDFEDKRSGEFSDDKFTSTLNTQVRVIRSWTLCNQTAKALELEKNKDFMQGVKPGADLGSLLQNNLIVQPVRGSRLIEIHAEHPNPKVAALLADGIAQQYIHQNAQQTMSASLDAVRWLGQQAEELKVRLAASEASLLRDRQQTDSISLEERQGIVVATLKELNAALTKAQTERLSAEADWTQVKTLLDAGQKSEEIPSIAKSTEVSALRYQAGQKEVAIAVLQRRYLAQHPAMLAAQTELKELIAKRAQACDEAVRQIQARCSAAKANEVKLQEALKDQERKALELDRNRAGYDELKRSVETDRQLYSTVLTRMKEAGLMGKLTANNVRLLDPVQTPVRPARPNVKYTILLAILLGLFGGIGITLLLDSLDDRIKSFADVESLGLPMLSGVPRMHVPDATQGGRVLQTEPNSAYADAFHGLRASIGLKPAAKDAKTLMVTSTTSGEGKTMVAANLSISYALHGERTLLIDCDLRQPGLGRIFKTQPEKGLEKFLADSMSLQDIIQSTDVPNLEVISVGDGQHNCAELLASPRLPELLKEAADLYDRVVIDSPPVMAASDSLILLPYAKGVVFVVGSGKTHREDAERAMQKLRDCGAPLVGVVMNNVDGVKEKDPDFKNGNGNGAHETDNVSAGAV